MQLTLGVAKKPHSLHCAARQAEGTLRKGETYPDVILSTIGERVDEEGLPPFVSIKETMQAINDQRGEEAKARRAMFNLLKEREDRWGGAQEAGR